MQKRTLWGPALAVVCFACPGEASAIIMRHDIPESDYAVEDADYPALVDLFEPGDCIGTLISAEYLLTVAHCAEDMNAGRTLSVAGTPHEVAEVVLHPEWRNFKYDIALIRLSTPVADIDPYPIYRSTDEAGRMLTLVGRGVHGTGVEGEPGARQDTQLRRATNVVAGASEQWLKVDFEAPGTDGITDLEGVGASGDSGGPAFLETADGWVIAGLNSWGDGGPGIRVGQYGAQDFSTRVSHFADWIDSVVGEPASADTGLESDDQDTGAAGAAAESDGTDKGCGCTTVAGLGPLPAGLVMLGMVVARRRRDAVA